MRHLVLIGLCILLVMGCTPPSPKPKAAGAKTNKDTDRPGGNYHSFELPAAIANPSLCDSACKKDAKCKSWSYVKPAEGKQARCNLKSNVPPAVPDVCCFSGVKPGAVKPKPKAAVASGKKAMSKAEIRRERRKLERDHKNKLRELENESKKIERQFASRRKALEKKKAKSGGSPKDLAPLQKQVTELTAQKESKNKELEELQAAIAKQREELKMREKELKQREQEAKKKNREFQTFARGVDGKIAKTKARMEKVQAAASSKTSALAKEEQKVAEEEKAAKAALEQQMKEAEAAYKQMMADLEKAAAAPAPTPAPTPKPTPAKVAGGVELDTDRPGGDYRIIVLDEASPRVCRAACQGEGQCKAWTYVKPKVLGNKARCFLKNNVPNKEKSACCVSGIKN